MPIPASGVSAFQDPVRVPTELPCTENPLRNFAVKHGTENTSGLNHTTAGNGPQKNRDAVATRLDLNRRARSLYQAK